VTAIYFVAVLFGLAGWQGPMAERMGLTVSLYVVAFSVVGTISINTGRVDRPLAASGGTLRRGAGDLLRAAAGVRLAVCGRSPTSERVAGRLCFSITGG